LEIIVSATSVKLADEKKLFENASANDSTIEVDETKDKEKNELIAVLSASDE
jgi:hypothetical protein